MRGLIRLGVVLGVAGLGAWGQSFTSVGAMGTVRNSAAAVRLSNGIVLIAGGWNANGATSYDIIPLASAEIYDPASATFSNTGSMGMGRSSALAEPLPGDKAMIIGGESTAVGRGALATSTEIYDAASGTFSPGPELPQGLQAPLAAALPDGRIWISGAPASCTGYGCPSPAYIYDPASNAFTADGALTLERVQATVVVLASGKVLVVSGWGDNPGTSPLSSDEIYDPATGVSTLGTGNTSVGLGVAQASGVLLANGAALLCGGETHFGPAQECDLYDAAHDAWSPTGVMQEARLSPVAFVLPDGSVLEVSSDQNPNAEIYAPAPGTFSTAGNFNTQRALFSAVQLADGAVLFAGGGTASAEVFTPGSIVPDFSLTTPHAEVVTGGMTAVIPITAAGSGGFNGSIDLSCTGNQTITCSFAPDAITPGQTSTLSVTGLTLTATDQIFTVVGASGLLTNNLPLQISVEPPVAALTPQSLTFGSVAVGATGQAQTITINNEGGSPLHISGIVAGGDFSQTNDCPATLPNGALGCTVTVFFRPTAAGQRGGSVAVSDDSPQPPSPQMVALTGTATAPPAPVAQLTPGSLSFDATTAGATSAAATLTLSNTGNADLAGITLAITGPFAQSSSCGATLAAAAKCTIAVTFAPTGGGAQTGSLTVSDNAASSPQSVALTGVGVAAAPNGALAPTQLTFSPENVGATSDAQQITLTNSGTAALGIASIAASGDFAATNNCGASLAAGKNCAVAVSFTPTAAGTRNGQLTVSPSSGSPMTATLTGVGVTAPGSGGSAGVSFQMPPGASTSQTVTPGQAATYALQLAGNGGFTGAVALACTGAPSGASCTTSPASVTVGSGTAAATVTVTTAAGSAIPWLAPESLGWLGWLGLFGLLLTAMACQPRRRKLVWLGAAALALAGCGGSANPNAAPAAAGATPAGTYTLTVTATAAGAAVGSESLTLIVQ